MKYIINSFVAGLSDWENKGSRGSFKFGKNLDIRKKRDSLSCNQAMLNETPPTEEFNNLIDWWVPSTDGNIYGFSRNGRIYKRSELATYSLNFNLASSEYAYILDADQTGLDLSTDFTIEGWIRLSQLPSVAGTTFTIVAKNSLGDNQRAFQMFIGTDDKLYCDFYANGSGSNYTRFKMDEAFDSDDIGEWIHIAAVADISVPTISFYKMAVLKAGSSDSLTATTINNSTAPFSIGGRVNNGTPDNLLDGDLKDIRIWSTLRTQPNIADNMYSELVGNEAGLVANWKLNKDVLDSTNNDNDLTTVNGPSFSSEYPEGYEIEESEGYTWTLVYTDVAGAILGAMEWGQANGKQYLFWATATKLNAKEIPGASDWSDVNDSIVIGGDTFTYPKTNLTNAPNHMMQGMGGGIGALVINNGNTLAMVGYDGSYTNEILRFTPGQEAKILLQRNSDAIVGTRSKNQLYKSALFAWDGQDTEEVFGWDANKPIPLTDIAAMIDTEVGLLVDNKGQVFFSDFVAGLPIFIFPDNGKVSAGGVTNEEYLALFGVWGNGSKSGIYSYGRKWKNAKLVPNLEYSIECDEIEIGRAHV